MAITNSKSAVDRMKNSIENAKPENSIALFWEECTAPKMGAKISEMHIYLSYAAWYINIYEAGPSASYDKFINWLRRSNLDYNMGPDDVRWVKNVTLTQTFMHYMTAEETDVLSKILIEH